MDAEQIAGRLGEVSDRRLGADGLWLTVPDLDPRLMAEVLREAGARLATMTAVEDDNGVRLIYHWDVAGALLNVATPALDGSTASIADIWPAADWAEREIHDYYAIEFMGRAETPPLMLRDGDEPGLFSRTRSVSRDADPSDSGWSRGLVAGASAGASEEAGA